MNVLGMGPLELGLIAALALVVLGPDKLPDLARQIGRAVAELRRMSADVTSEFQRSLQVDDPSRTRVARPAPPPAQPRESDTEDLRPPY